MGSKFYVIYNINMIHICFRGVGVNRTVFKGRVQVVDMDRTV